VQDEPGAAEIRTHARGTDPGGERDGLEHHGEGEQQDADALALPYRERRHAAVWTTTPAAAVQAAIDPPPRAPASSVRSQSRNAAR
jgi:hypothetical protein